MTPIGIENEIYFFRANEQWGEFSNLYQRSIEFENREYPTAEHAYQAGKPKREVVREWLLNAPHPCLVAIVGNYLPTWEIVPNFSQIKYARMRAVLRAKFSQHEDLRQLLLSSGDARLIEAPRTDNSVNREWGAIKGKGKNMLGLLLMELRSELRQAHS